MQRDGEKNKTVRFIHKQDNGRVFSTICDSESVDCKAFFKHRQRKHKDRRLCYQREAES